MDEFTGWKQERDWVNRSITFAQPMMIQSFEDEFETNNDKTHARPAEPGSISRRCKEGAAIEMNKQKKVRSGTGKLLQMMRWSRPDICNAVRELSKQMKASNLLHYEAMYRVMEYVM